MAMFTSIAREIREMVESELGLYPVDYSFDVSKNNKAAVEIRAGNGSKGRVRFPPNMRGHAGLLNIRSDIRKELKTMGVEPRPDRRRAAKAGVGCKMLEAADDALNKVHTLEAHEPIGPLDEDMFAAMPVAIKKEPTAVTEPAKSLTVTTPAANGNGIANGKSNGHDASNKPFIVNKVADEKRSYVKLQHPEVALISRLILTHARIDDATKTLTFNDGWDDKRIAAVLAAEPGREGISERHVQAIRRESFGYTQVEHDRRNPKTPATLDELRAHIAQLEERIVKLEDAVTTP